MDSKQTAKKTAAKQTAKKTAAKQTAKQTAKKAAAKVAGTKSTDTKLSAKSTATRSSTNSSSKLSAKTTATRTSTRSSTKLSAKSTATRSSTRSSTKLSAKSSIPPDYLNTKLFIENNLKSKKLIKIDKNTYFINKPKYGGIGNDSLRNDIVLTSSGLPLGAHPRQIPDVGLPPPGFITFLINRISNVFDVEDGRDHQVYLQIASPTRLPNPQDIVLTRLYNSVSNQYPNLYILVIIERSGPKHKKNVIIKICGGTANDPNVISRDFGHLSLMIGRNNREANPHFTFNRTSPLGVQSEVMRLYFNYDNYIRYTMPHTMQLFGELIASNAYHLSMLHAEQDLHRTVGIPVDYYLLGREVTFVSDLMWLVARYFRNQINNAIDPMRRFTLDYVANEGTAPVNLIQGIDLIRGDHPGLVDRTRVVRRPVMGPTGIRMLNSLYFGGKNK